MSGQCKATSKFANDYKDILSRSNPDNSLENLAKDGSFKSSKSKKI